MDPPVEQVTGPPLRILSIDGGGVRGLSSLLILERIMERIKQSESLSEVPRPCDRFDFIGGAGTGGIIAIMLGRLKMTVNDSIRAYKKLSETGFYEKPKTWQRSTCAFSARKLEAAIKLAIRENCCELSCVEQRKSNNTCTADTCTHEDMCFYEESCVKTAVLAITKDNVDALPTIFKTYPEPITSLVECKVWEVARATSAAVAFFKPIKLGRDRIEFIDAAFGNNNPCETLITEAESVLPGRKTIALSLGTGLGDVVEINNIKKSITSAFERMTSSSKGAHQRLKDKYRGTSRYFRLNVISGLRDVTLLDSSVLSKISAHTTNYLIENDDLISECVEALTKNEDGQTEGQRSICNDEKDKKCLVDLCVTDPRTDKKSIESKKGGLLKDCYQWILKHQDFKRFLNERESRILWIKGDPGKGKTMLLCGIIDQLDLDKSVSVSYFFCQATGNQLNTATSVLRGLIYYLAYYNPHLTKYVRSKHDYRKDIFVHENAWHDLCEILTTMLNDPSLRNAILIVDALDECNVGRQELLEFIAQQGSPAKWIVSSRNWPDIEEILDDAEQKVKIHLEANQNSISDAVELYIQAKVDELARKKRYDDKMKMEVLQHLRSNANGTFLWAALVCQELSNANARKWHTPVMLKSFPPGLNALYERMLQQISQSQDAQLCRDIIATSLVVYRPITLEELHSLVHELEYMDKENVAEVIALCGSFLTVHGNVISFVHQSAKDYLLEKALDEIVPSGMPQQHQKVLLRSLEIVHQRLQRDIYNLKAPGCLIDEVLVPQPDPLAGIRYSCIFWVDHICEFPVYDIPGIYDGILALFKDKYLQWLEALSLLRSISSAGRAMDKLRLLLQEKASQNLQDIVKDAQRFLLSYGGVIEIAPLQVYVSALIFSPTRSLIRQIYSHEEPDWIQPKPWVEESWDVCLRTLEDHDEEVTSVVFSNGQRLASGSGDKTIKIWDATSGVCLQTLEGHGDWVRSMVFSNDGQRLASGSDDTTVKIWDLTSGMCLQTLEGHDDWVKSVALSHDGKRLASGSLNKTVKIWDAISGVCLQTLEGHYGAVTSVAFLNDEQRLASGSGDSAIKIWDITSGTCLQTLEGHDDSVAAVVFSNYGQLLASGSDDKNVKIWDATSGKCLQTFAGHDRGVTSVVFSNDGQRLASGSWDKTAKIWDVTSGECLQTLEDHDFLVTSVSFSSDGQQLASGSGDKTVKIWDAAFGACLETLGGHDYGVTSLLFSNDERRLASGSFDKTVKIWDATSGACLHTLKGHDDLVRSVVFSTDARLLASGSADKTVRIWDATSGACLHTLEGHSNIVTSVALSNDGQQLASGSLDNTVKIWDVASAACLHSLEGHDLLVTSVVFSHDGHRLASASGDSTVRIWDAISGACLQTFMGHDRGVTSVVLSNNGQRLASGSFDKTVKIWDATSGACLHTLEGHDRGVISVLFSDDGQRLASGSDDRTVKIWDATSGACLWTLEGRDEELTSVVFSNTEQQPSSTSLANQTSFFPSISCIFSISKDGVWIEESQQRVLWLPPSRRPRKSVFAPKTIALGSLSGRITVIGFRSTD